MTLGSVAYKVLENKRVRITDAPPEISEWVGMVGSLVAAADEHWFFPDSSHKAVRLINAAGWAWSPLAGGVGSSHRPQSAANATVAAEPSYAFMPTYDAPTPEPRRAREVYDHDAFATDLDKVLAEVRKMLISKNLAYGDSALSPLRVFSKASTMEQLFVRIDDKLSRLKRGEAAGEDVLADLRGYLVLVRIAEMRAELDK